MSKFKKGKKYTYLQIQDAVEDPFDSTGFILGIAAYGPQSVGQHFLSVEENGCKYAFVLVGKEEDGKALYECVYSDGTTEEADNVTAKLRNIDFEKCAQELLRIPGFCEAEETAVAIFNVNGRELALSMRVSADEDEVEEARSSFQEKQP